MHDDTSNILSIVGNRTIIKSRESVRTHALGDLLPSGEILDFAGPSLKTTGVLLLAAAALGVPEVEPRSAWTGVRETGAKVG